MTPQMADALVTELFKKFADGPLHTEGMRQRGLSEIAAVICDTGHEWLKAGSDAKATDVITLHEAYGRVAFAFRARWAAMPAFGAEHGHSL